MPEPGRLLEAEMFHYPTDDRLTTNEYQAGDVKDHLENVKNVNFRSTIGPPSYAGEFEKDVIQMENYPAHEERRETEQREISVADVSAGQLRCLLATGHFFSPDNENHHGHNSDRHHTEHGNVRNIVGHFDPYITGLVIGFIA